MRGCRREWERGGARATVEGRAELRAGLLRFEYAEHDDRGAFLDGEHGWLPAVAGEVELRSGRLFARGSARLARGAVTYQSSATPAGRPGGSPSRAATRSSAGSSSGWAGGSEVRPAPSVYDTARVRRRDRDDCHRQRPGGDLGSSSALR